MNTGKKDFIFKNNLVKNGNFIPISWNKDKSLGKTKENKRVKIITLDRIKKHG